MSNALSQYYLQAMGIDSWVMRTNNSSREKELSLLVQEVVACTKCSLHESRSQTVFSRGNPQAKLMIIGEAPGFYEDKQGLPFVGKAGMLLNQMLHSIGFDEQSVYVANVLKCRPPNNRDPKPEEIIQCSSYLARQIDLVKPILILAMGRFAGQFLINKPLPLNQLRQKLYNYNNTPFMVSYHPAYLLRNPADKKKSYADLLLVKKFLSENT
ncbi:MULTISPECIES: uracil-DNA glycosylase [unclassified Legionella]|uniref:uracil-DNA glycosylase n=1 Tax=unclassified Legionella TaxID=2622702 RepID=UPI001054F20F|nr:MULTISPECIES: uracil-DNA glycosylase [unclassified Legionella]MDI9819890.1 uracil-DNA glycosylase [Legionella sp. PL877]